jgi:hypothetical protein
MPAPVTLQIEASKPAAAEQDPLQPPNRSVSAHSAEKERLARQERVLSCELKHDTAPAPPLASPAPEDARPAPITPPPHIFTPELPGSAAEAAPTALPADAASGRRCLPSTPSLMPTAQPPIADVAEPEQQLLQQRLPRGHSTEPREHSTDQLLDKEEGHRGVPPGKRLKGGAACAHGRIRWRCSECSNAATQSQAPRT